METERSAKILIGDEEYTLLLTTKATKEIAGRYGGLENLGDQLMKAENFEMALSEIVWLITLLANQSILIHNLKNKEQPKELLTEELVELPLEDFLSMDEEYIREVLDLAYEETFTEFADTVVEQGKTTVRNEAEEEIEVDCITVSFGITERKLDVDALYEQVMEGYLAQNFELQAVYEESYPQTLDLDKLYTVEEFIELTENDFEGGVIRQLKERWKEN